MRYVTALAGFFLIAASSPVAAQSYPGDDVTVNSGAAGTQVLHYPGSNYVRVVPALRQPGETYGPIRLHMPARHHFARVKEPLATPLAEAPVAAPPPPAKRSAAVADYGDMQIARPESPAPRTVRPAPPPRMARTEPPPQPAARIEPPPQRVARVEPPPARTLPQRNPEADSGSKRGVVLFAPNASDPSVSALQSAKSLAGDLSAALAESTARVQLLAFGGQHGDKSSDTRRLSLKRALIIRQILIDNGVPSERIDVRAMGGTDDNGPLDRVDVFLKS